MAAVHKVASIKVLLNANAEELEKEKNAVNVTLEKGCLHMISSHNSDDLFNILNVELSFDKWLSLHVQALPLDVQAPLHDLQQTFKLYHSLESVVPWKVQVEEFLLSLPLFNTAYNDFWWIFDLQEQREQREQPAPDSIKESLGMPLIQENQYLVDTGGRAIYLSQHRIHRPTALHDVRRHSRDLALRGLGARSMRL